MLYAIGISVLALVLIAVAPQAIAQNDSTADLRAEQSRLFDRLYEEPSNLDLMFDYAVVSIRLQDYEPAISTLERMLIYRRDLSRVRLELAAAYFNLGSYEVAKNYFNQVLDDPELSGEARERVALYLNEIEGRTKRSSLSLVTNVGITYATNANLGPLSNEVTVGGVPGFVLDADSQSQSDFGVRMLVYGTHTYDLRQPNTNAWLTDFGVFGLRYFDVTAGNTLFARVRTGPQLALDAKQYGPKLRPYFEGKYLNADDQMVLWNGTGGAEYTRALNDKWAAFADANVGYYDFVEDRDGEDSLTLRLLAGGAYLPSRDLTGRISTFVERDFADADFNSNVEVGISVSAGYSYDSGLDAVDRKWVVSAYADVRYRWYDEADPFIDPDETRRDLDLGVGFSHLFAIRDGLGIKLDVEAFRRESNISNFDLENVSVTLSVQMRL